MTSSQTSRRVLLLAHTGRAEARAVAVAFVEGLTREGVVVRLMAAEAKDLGVEPSGPGIELTESETDASRDCDLTLVIGGDGSILRAVEFTHDSGTPVLGVSRAPSSPMKTPSAGPAKPVSTVWRVCIAAASNAAEMRRRVSRSVPGWSVK